MATETAVPAPAAEGTATRTIAALWRRAATAERSRPAYLVEADGQWLPMSWPEAAQAVTELANGLLALGVAKGDAFGILASTTLEWALFDFALALVGAVALTAERTDELADSLAERGGMSRDEVRGWIDDATSRWRGDAVRVGEKAGATLNSVFRELGLVTRDVWDELELRVAQLEQRQRLVEGGARAELPRAT